MQTKALLDYLPLVATVFLTICYAPQIFKTAKTKDVSGMSVAFWVILCLALGCMWTNALVIYLLYHTYGYLVTESLNLALALVVLVQVLVYRKK